MWSIFGPVNWLGVPPLPLVQSNSSSKTFGELTHVHMPFSKSQSPLWQTKPSNCNLKRKGQSESFRKSSGLPQTQTFPLLIHFIVVLHYFPVSNEICFPTDHPASTATDTATPELVLTATANTAPATVCQTTRVQPFELLTCSKIYKYITCFLFADLFTHLGGDRHHPRPPHHQLQCRQYSLSL